MLMKQTRRIVILVACLFFLAACAPAPAASQGSIQIFDPWIRPALSGGNSAAYMVIKNTGSQDDQLVGAAFSPAQMVSIMETTMQNNHMSMADVSSIAVPAGGQVELKAGGYHVMLMNLAGELKTGDSVSLTLNFQKAGAVTLQVPVKQ
jgi:copper(I)-binding protein